jgi:hypothetical protein
LSIYYNERVIENTVDEDSGAMIRDGIKTVAEEGGPHETLWPHNISKFKTKPSAAVQGRRKHRAILPARRRSTRSSRVASRRDIRSSSDSPSTKA